MVKKTQQISDIFTAILSLAFIIGVIVYEVGLYSYFSQDGSPWLIMVVMNVIYLMVSFAVIGGLSTLGPIGMVLGFIISIAGLFLFGITSFSL